MGWTLRAFHRPPASCTRGGAGRSVTAPLGAIAMTRMDLRAESAGEAVREADRAGLGRRIGDEVGAAEHPGDRGAVDDSAAAELAHVRTDRLRRKELVAEVHVQRLVPVCGRHLVENVPVVLGGIIDQDRHRSDPLRIVATAVLRASSFICHMVTGYGCYGVRAFTSRI